MIAQIVPVVSNNVQMIETIIWKAARIIAKDWPDDRDDPIHLGRVEFYPGDRVNFEAIIWKCSQTTETIRTIIIMDGDMLTHTLRSKAIPEILTFIPVIKNKFGLDGAEVEKNNTKMFARIRRYLKLDIKFSM